MLIVKNGMELFVYCFIMIDVIRIAIGKIGINISS